MRQSYPPHQILWHAQYVPQYVYLQLVEIAIYMRFEECLELVHAFFNLRPRLGINGSTIAVVFWYDAFVGRFLREAKSCWVRSEKPFFGSIDGAVGEFVDGVDDVVE